MMTVGLRFKQVTQTWINRAPFCVISWFTDCCFGEWALAEPLFTVAFLEWCHVCRPQVLWRSEVTSSASFGWSGRASPAAEHARCGQSPSCGSPLLDAGTPPRDVQSPWQPSRPPPGLPATYACMDEWDKDLAGVQKFHFKKHLTYNS